jgi:hypothetical protein
MWTIDTCNTGGGDNPQLQANGKDVLPGTNITVGGEQVLAVAVYCVRLQEAVNFLWLKGLMFESPGGI